MPFKILVADDEPDAELLFRQFFRARIRNGELALVFAENGKVALELLSNDASIEIGRAHV